MRNKSQLAMKIKEKRAETRDKNRKPTIPTKGFGSKNY